MKKRILSAAIAVAVLMTTGCSFKDIKDKGVDVVENLINSDVSDIDDTDSDDDGEASSSKVDRADELTSGISFSVAYYSETCIIEDMPELHMEIQQLIVMDPGYDALQKALNDINEINYMRLKAYWDTDRLLTTAAIVQEEGDPCWHDMLQMGSYRNDSYVFSLAVDRYMQVACDEQWATVIYNINPVNGERYEIDTFVKDYDKFYKAVISDIKNGNAFTYGDIDDSDYLKLLNSDWEDYMYDLFYGEGNLVWGVSAEDVFVAINAGLIADAGAGDFMIRIDMDRYPELLNLDYFYHEDELEWECGYEPYYDALIDEVYMPLADKLVDYTYDDCIRFLEENGWEYDCHSPEECDAGGHIVVFDGVTGFEMTLTFGPLYDCMGESIIEDAVLYGLTYNTPAKDYMVMQDGYGGREFSVFDYESGRELCFYNDWGEDGYEFYRYMWLKIFA